MLPNVSEMYAAFMFRVEVSGKLLLAFASTVILGFGSGGTHDHIFQSHDSD
jgi:hypothetical protein